MSALRKNSTDTVGRQLYKLVGEVIQMYILFDWERNPPGRAIHVLFVKLSFLIIGVNQPVPLRPSIQPVPPHNLS